MSQRQLFFAILACFVFQMECLCFDSLVPENDWMIEQHHFLNTHQSHPDEKGPFIRMAGFMDSELTYQRGGQFRLVAFVTDVDFDVREVEIFYQGEPTGVFLRDDGLNGDFDANDQIWGIILSFDSYQVPPNQYRFEIQAIDDAGNCSGLWPYLNIFDQKDFKK